MSRVFVLGAGFSVPAGLPLASDLFVAVRQTVRKRYGLDNWVEGDLERYVAYTNATSNASFKVADVDLEEFVGFLDTEHYLGLKGKDTWSTDGNESQLLIRNAIAEVLYNRTPTDPADIPPVYLEFAKRLTTSDWVLTFNYDILLESALRAVGLPYRRFPDRYSDVGVGSNTIDNSHDELVLLKMHGSIDWFDRSSFIKQSEIAASQPVSYDIPHAVFGKDSAVTAIPLTEGVRSHDDPLNEVFWVEDIGPLLDKPFFRWTPLILSPSTAKLYGGKAIRELWWGSQRGGGWNLAFNIVGYSLPSHDSYAMQMLYHTATNYTEYEWEEGIYGKFKSPLRVLDFRTSPTDQAALLNRYQFLNSSRSDVNFTGFSTNSLDWLFKSSDR